MLAALARRCHVLGLDVVPVFLLLGDVAVLGALVALLLGRLDIDDRRPLRAFLAAGLLLLATVVGSVGVLGWLGLLDWRALLLSHVLLAGAALGRGGRPYGPALAAAGERARRLSAGLVAPWARLLRRAEWDEERRVENLLLVAILVVLAFYGVLALFSFPLNYDSNVYRLTRIAYWLQEAAFRDFALDETRLNFLPRNADLVMLWLTSFFDRHFPLVALAQYFAGLLGCAAVYELCRAIGLARVWRLAAVLAFLGTPNAAVQFPTSQTDLFTTGCLTAGLFFLLEALGSRRARDWCLFGIGFGLAVGTKPTVLYWGPGLVFLLAGWSIAERAGWRTLAKGLALAAPAAICLGGPAYFHNWMLYGSDLAPAEAFGKVHKAATGGSRLYFALVNFLAYLWQTFEPDSNPPLLSRLLDYPFRALAALLLSLPPHYEQFHERFVRMRGWLGYGPHEDYASFGLALLLAALLGGGVALANAARRRRSGMIAGVAFLSSVLFFAPFCLLQSWTLHKFRYFVLLTPLLAVLAAYGLAALPRRGGRTAALVFLACQFALALQVGIDGRDHGLRTLLRPERSYAYDSMLDDQRLLERLGPRPRRIAIALPRDARMAAFMRSAVRHRIELARMKRVKEYPTLEAFLNDTNEECVLTDPRLARARPGHVEIHLIDSPGVATRILACRTTRDDMPRPVFFATRGFFADGWTGLETGLRFEGAHDGEAFAELWNPTSLTRRVEIAGAKDREELTLAPMEKRTVRLATASRDALALRVTPAFVPAEQDPASPDRRALGVQMRLFTTSDGSG